MVEKNAGAEELAHRAYLYVSGELTESERALFELQLSRDQPASEALAEAVRISSALLGSTPRPNPAYRERVKARLQPTWWRRLLGRRTSIGHPVLWTLAGAAASLLISLTVLRPDPEVRVIHHDRILFVDEGDNHNEDPSAALHDMAFIWAELSTPDHVVKTHTDEERRKDRRQWRRLVHASNGP